MNKEQSADDPSVDLIRVKICLIAPFLYDILIACTRYKVSLEAFRAIEQRW